jgi:virulence-associated protein VapD
MFALMLENESANVVDINDGAKYQVISASGLNPPSASIFTAKSPNKKGVKYNGSTLDERIIVITVKLLGDIEANRNALYDWVDTEQYVKVKYKNGKKDVYCEGHIQDCDIDLFTDNEVVSIAILCENPYWKAAEEIARDISSILKQFTFPFAIGSVGVPFSTIRANTSTQILNVGAETGVRITVKCVGDVKNLVIFDARDATKAFRLNATLKAGQVLEIDTESSPKTVKVINPDGTTENYLKYTENPTWFTLKKGANYFAHAAENGATNAEITIGYTNKYLGV